MFVEVPVLTADPPVILINLGNAQTVRPHNGGKMTKVDMVGENFTQHVDMPYAEFRALVFGADNLAEANRQIFNLHEGIRCVLASTSEQWIHDVLNACMSDDNG